MSKFIVTANYDATLNTTYVQVLETNNPAQSKEIASFQGKITTTIENLDIHVLENGSNLGIAISYINNKQMFLKHIVLSGFSTKHITPKKYEKDYICKEKPEFIADFTLFDDNEYGFCLLPINYKALVNFNNIFYISNLFNPHDSDIEEIINERIQNEIQSSKISFKDYPEILAVQCEETPSFCQPENIEKKAILMTIITKYGDPFQLLIEDKHLGLLDTPMYIYDIVSCFPTTCKTPKIHQILHPHVHDGFIPYQAFRRGFQSTEFYIDYVVNYFQRQCDFEANSKNNLGRLLKKRKKQQ